MKPPAKARTMASHSTAGAYDVVSGAGPAPVPARRGSP